MAEKGLKVLRQPVCRFIDPIITIVAVMTNLTAIQRIVWVYHHGKGVP